MKAARGTWKGKLPGRNCLLWLAGTAAVFLLILMLGPADAFSHGYLCDTPSPSEIDAEDYRDSIELEGSEGGYTFSFIPARRHFLAFQVALDGIEETDAGTVLLTISRENGRVVDKLELELSEMSSRSWEVVYVNASLKKGTTYLCTIEAGEDCSSSSLSLLVVDEDYLGPETEGDNVLIGYVYRESTFTVPEKTLLILLILGFWALLSGHLMMSGQNRKRIYTAAAFLIMSSVLAWNYMYNFFDSGNDEFDDFEYEGASEIYVVGPIVAQGQGITATKYGVATYKDSMGRFQNYGDETVSYVTDSDWLNGYSRTGAQILISNNTYTAQIAAAGNYIEFANGDIFEIIDSTEFNDYLIVTLYADRHLNYYKYGDLFWAKYYDADMNPLDSGELVGHSSLFGLQGKVFRHLAVFINGENFIDLFHLVCSLATATVFALIVILLRQKYNNLMAGCFFVTFLLSPWVVNFGQNLYWVEFTWFLPMLAGLFCCLHQDSRKWIAVCCGAAFVTIMVKALCGYEYISTVMMGLIAFPLADLACAVFRKDRALIRRTFGIVFALGCSALLGFAAALLLHANLAGDGNLQEGFQVILEIINKRTAAGVSTDFSGAYRESLEASIWETVLRYFNFNFTYTTEIITGIPGSLFPALCFLPLVIYAWEYKNRDLRAEEVMLYAAFFIAAVSWYALGKGHSYIHTHLNFVLWYLGFVQICFYSILRPAADFVLDVKELKKQHAESGTSKADFPE